MDLSPAMAKRLRMGLESHHSRQRRAPTRFANFARHAKLPHILSRSVSDRFLPSLPWPVLLSLATQGMIPTTKLNRPARSQPKPDLAVRGQRVLRPPRRYVRARRIVWLRLQRYALSLGRRESWRICG